MNGIHRTILKSIMLDIYHGCVGHSRDNHIVYSWFRKRFKR